MSFPSQSLWLAILVVSVSLTVAINLSAADVPMSEQHEKWMTQHGRVYKDAEEKAHRFEIFKANAKYVQSVNSAGNRTYQLGLNRFADLTNEEFKATFLGFKPNPPVVNKEEKVEKPFRYANLADVPDAMDWRASGAVTGVKDQGSCGCCWAFSAVAAMEGIVQLSTGQLMSLSEQEVLDCTGNGMSCNGGTMNAAFSFVIRNRGIATETDYPYTTNQGYCQSGYNIPSATTIGGYEEVPKNEVALLNAAANQPVSVGVDGSGNDFKYYSGGIFTGSCGTNMEHAVTVVGYGESAGTKYWLVKNSWGTNWGEGGYMRMQRDIGSYGGLCGIALMASYPTI